MVLGESRKIARGPSGIIAGAAGDAHVCGEFLEMVRADKLSKFKVTDAKDMLGLLIYPDKRMFTMDGAGRLCTLTTAFTAIGSGNEIAMGAMWAGATARQAVQAAIDLHEGIGGRIAWLRLGGGRA